MFTAPIGEKAEPSKDTESKVDEGGKDTPQPIINMLKRQLTKENIESLGFIEFPYVQGQFEQYLSGKWEAGYGGLPRCLRICLLIYSLLILKERFNVNKWVKDL
jgi:hypothetical protein